MKAPFSLSPPFDNFANGFCAGGDRHFCLPRARSIDDPDRPYGHVQARIPVRTRGPAMRERTNETEH